MNLTFDEDLLQISSFKVIVSNSGSLAVLYLSPSAGVIGFIEVIEIALMISLLQTEPLTPNSDQTLRHVIQSLPPHREVGEGGKAEGEISPVEMAFRSGLVD